MYKAFQKNFTPNFMPLSGQHTALARLWGIYIAWSCIVEFSVSALPSTYLRQSGEAFGAAASAHPTPAINESPAQALELSATSGLRLDYASANATVTFGAVGCLILALRQPVRLTLGEQEVRIPKYGAYFVPAAQRSRTDPTLQSLRPIAAIEDAPIIAQAQSTGPWLMMSASDVTWRVLSTELRRMGAHSAQPVAGLWHNAKALARWALHTIRRTRAAVRSTLEPIMLFELAQAFQATLAGFAPLVERCPGRWQNQKYQVFRRLMCVRQFIDLRCTDSLPIERLAAMANYSRAHFMTIFRTVFEETPHTRLLDRRLLYAQRMLGENGMSVQETTLAAGFEDRSSFSKLFRRRFGVTALATRQAAVQGSAGIRPWGKLVLL
jgi:AraC-like DNA-binding protein